MSVLETAAERRNYQITEGGTAYHASTPRQVIEVLEQARKSGQRIKIHLGEPETGAAWGDIETGYIGRSTGRIQVPLVISKRNSMGGGALLDDCIVKIEHANKRDGGTLYEVAR